MTRFTAPSELGIAKQKIVALQLEIRALRECIGNYELAIKEAQNSTCIAIKISSKHEKKLNRLITLVTHNARNSETILKQLEG